MWLAHELREVFGIQETLSGANAGAVYDELSDKLARPAYRPRALFERFGIETLCTMDDASDPLASHQAIRDSGLAGDVRPTFRPDAVLNVAAPGWRASLAALEETCRCQITTTEALLEALADRRRFFREMGATATDHGVETPFTIQLERSEADAILGRALRGKVTTDDHRRFVGHMLIQMAALSVEDGLTMQLPVGSFRNHDRSVSERFGPDRGADIPVTTEFTRNLRPLLDRFGDDRRLTLIPFTLHEAAEPARRGAPPDVMAGGDRGERARVVVESRRVADPGRLDDLVKVPGDPVGAVMEPPRRHHRRGQCGCHGR